MKNETFILINSKVLPPVFNGVLAAKEMLSNGTANNATQAVKMAGISRSAFYKYRNYVYKYEVGEQNTINLTAELSNKAGVLSLLTTTLYKYGANIIMVNQSIPVDGIAKATLTVRTDNIKISLEELVDILSRLDGVITIKAI